MIHFLRDSSNKTIIETEVWNKQDSNSNEIDKYTEISSSVDIYNYSIFLLSTDIVKSIVIIEIGKLDELRGWLWESFYMVGMNDGTKKDEIEGLVRDMYKDAAEKLGLHYVTD